LFDSDRDTLAAQDGKRQVIRVFPLGAAGEESDFLQIEMNDGARLEVCRFKNVVTRTQIEALKAQTLEFLHDLTVASQDPLNLNCIVAADPELAGVRDEKEQWRMKPQHRTKDGQEQDGGDRSRRTRLAGERERR